MKNKLKIGKSRMCLFTTNCVTLLHVFGVKSLVTTYKAQCFMFVLKLLRRTLTNNEKNLMDQDKGIKGLNLILQTPKSSKSVRAQKGQNLKQTGMDWT